MRNSAITSVALLVISASAAASDFSGPYVGASAGYGWSDVEYAYEDGTTGFGDFSDSQNIDGFEGGVFLGFRHQFPSRFVLGAEGGADLSGVDGTYSTTVGANTANIEFQKNHQLFFDVTLGFVVQDNMLIYGLIGYQNVELEAEALLNGASLGSEDDEFDAWRFGAGVERAVDERFSVRGQVYFTDYEKNAYDYANGQQETIGADETAVRVGVVSNF